MPAKGQTVSHCKWGHEIAQEGRDKAGECKACKRVRQREDRRIRRGTPESAFVTDSKPIPNLKEVRENMGLSQMDLARVSGVSKSHIQRIEVGENGASRRTRDKIVVAIVRLQKARLRQAKYKRQPYGKPLVEASLAVGSLD